MKIVFISNFLNHHQLPFCQAILNNKDIEFNFIATTPIPKSRLNFGYADMNKEYDFVVRPYENVLEKAKALTLSEEADVAIFGSAPEFYLKKRLKKGKLTFRYSERLYKIKKPFYLMPLVALKRFWQCGRHKSMYLLCSSAYTSADYAKTGTFINKAYKWGYFPEVKEYDDINHLIEIKKKNTILWAGRLIDWKHPELPIEIAKRLKDNGIDFQLNIIGNGELENELVKLINTYGLQNEVKMLGSMPPEKVREYMEESEIFMFTSDRNEGWGAVLNESMSSGCAVVASHIIGSVPFLINNNENGLIYLDGDIEDLYNKVKFLIDNPRKRTEMGKKAYDTLCNEWNAENAADKFIKLSREILKGNKNPDLFEDGVCSKAPILKDGWYKK